MGCSGFHGDAREGFPLSALMQLPRGTKRAGTNRFDLLCEAERTLVAYFDEPGSENGTELEAGILPGDSGGPFLLKVDGTWHVAGVCSMAETGDDELLGNYGDEIVGTRVSRHLEWIRTTME